MAESTTVTYTEYVHDYLPRLVITSTERTGLQAAVQVQNAIEKIREAK